MSKGKLIATALPQMLFAPIRMRHAHPGPPTGARHYDRPVLAATVEQATTKATDIPKQFSTGQTADAWPDVFLAECDEPITSGAPDLRGVWQVVHGPLKRHIERVEQAGNRVIITTGGLVHDMYADGTLENGVNDVREGSGEAIRVAARFEDGRLNLYPGDRGIVAVTRYLDGDEMRWRWGPWRSRLHRLSSPSDAI